MHEIARWPATHVFRLVFLTLLAAPALPFARLAEAQVPEQTREASPGEAEAQPSATGAVGEAIRCVVGDSACQEKARSEGREVVLVDHDGAPVTDGNVNAAAAGSVVAATYRTGTGRDVEFALAERAFADAVVRHDPGAPAPTPGRPNADAQSVLGPPDFRGMRDPGYLSLGQGGSLVVAFTDNVLVDVPGPDLAVFFAGAGVARVTVAISEDGESFAEAGTIRAAGEELMDIAAVAGEDSRYTHVRIRDVNPRKREEFRDYVAGPNIDAIGAIGAEAR